MPPHPQTQHNTTHTATQQHSDTNSDTPTATPIATLTATHAASQPHGNTASHTHGDTHTVTHSYPAPPPYFAGTGSSTAGGEGRGVGNRSAQSSNSARPSMYFWMALGGRVPGGAQRVARAVAARACSRDHACTNKTAHHNKARNDGVA